MKKKDMKKKGYKLRYATSQGGGIIVVLPFNPRRGVCEACGKSRERGEIKSTAIHHWYYAYKAKTVKENPILALENTSELCYSCHRKADAIRELIYTKPEKVAVVADLLRGKQKERFMLVLKAIVEIMDKNKDKVNPLANKLIEMIKNGEK